MIQGSARYFPYRAFLDPQAQHDGVFLCLGPECEVCKMIRELVYEALSIDRWETDGGR